MRSYLLTAVCWLLVTVGVPAQSDRLFSLEEVLSAPFPSELTSAPEGDRLAWVFNREGSRNIWIAEGPSFRGKPLTDRRGDDGIEISDLAFTPDGSQIVFVMGGAPNRQGEHPNPTHDPEGRERAIWIIPFSGGDMRKLAE
ncbi:MAG: hypothetical protein R3350_10885, partial [Saprospiraceae bacterium]|nr:hypothetical protein [Saprospiraceae bacterium]